MQNYFEQVRRAADFLRKKTGARPKLIVVLSGGLEAFLEPLEKPQKFSSGDIPHFPRVTAEGHKGELIFAQKNGCPLVVLNGRFHFYEGLTPRQVVFPYFVLNELGAKFLLTTNAVGGVRADLKPGDLVLIRDQINNMGTSPLIGLAAGRPTDPFVSMQNAYDSELGNVAESCAARLKIELKKGVYLGSPGPAYETPAESRMCRTLGADLVGMSTVFEVLTARFLQMRVVGLSIVTNASSDRHEGIMSHEEVLEMMRNAQTRIVALLHEVASELAKKA